MVHKLINNLKPQYKTKTKKRIKKLKKLFTNKICKKLLKNNKLVLS